MRVSPSECKKDQRARLLFSDGLLSHQTVSTISNMFVFYTGSAAFNQVSLFALLISACRSRPAFF